MKDSLECKLPLACKKGLIVQEIKGETLVYDLKRHRAHCLNQTAAIIWQQCDGQLTVSDALARLEQKLKTPVSEDFIWYTIAELEKASLLERRTAVEKPAVRLTRREMMLKTGKAAALSLPLITSILAPTAMQAASCRARAAACTSNAQCCSGKCVNRGGSSVCA